ncbi:HNH endonuclease [Arthrobacter phage Hestia]|uniref:HNH endonuclease n=1 Tax=Arthrobacter phage Hestia TaxID=2419609 RepID=A0A3G3M3F2_9CAUD|nr:HNH endonuclease [Arthrobacter phage Hestia]AYR00926.1 HNH endonuclease [Arthrobacter phage Hestia]
MRGPGRPPVDPSVRFWSKVDRRSATECWPWTAHLNTEGYGRIRVGDRKVMAHVFSWELAGHVVPDGMQLDHRCRNRACVNPAHLRTTTQYENMQNLNGAHTGSKTGVRGVSWVAKKSRYKVMVTCHHERHFGGYFKDLQEAAEAAKQLRLLLFTHNEADRRVA